MLLLRCRGEPGTNTTSYSFFKNAPSFVFENFHQWQIAVLLSHVIIVIIAQTVINGLSRSQPHKDAVRGTFSLVLRL